MVLEPWIQCANVACNSAACRASQTAQNGCAMSANAPGGACNSLLTPSDTSACQVDLSPGGLLYTKCSTVVDIINVICGTGP
jgi:hypothetical protein